MEVEPILNSFHHERLNELPNVASVYEMFRYKAIQTPYQHACGYRKLIKEIMERTKDGKLKYIDSIYQHGKT